MTSQWLVRLLRAITVATAMIAGTLIAHAGPTDIASVPLGTSPTATVLPNLMFVLDDSGSMAQEYTPDQVNDNGTCKSCGSGSCNMTGTACDRGYPPYYGAQYNIQYYNPAVTYSAGVNYAGASLGDQLITAARNNRYSTTDTSTFNLTTLYRDIWWCNTGTPAAADYNNAAICRRNGIDTGNPFNYSANGLPNTTYRFGFFRDVSNPVYYTITPTEYCTDGSLTVCTASTVPVTIGTVTYDKPAPVRWCRTTTAVDAAAPVTGGTPPTCRATVDGTYRYPRYGTFTRVDIVSTTTTYPRASTRTDCGPPPPAIPATTCTYAEEAQNFANWYSYYRSRMLQMKTVSGRVFSGLDDRYRIGFLTINAADATKYLKISKFETTPTTHKQDWFTKFYAQSPGPGTPLREALSRVGRHYAGVTTGINSFMPDDPIQYSCQSNYTLLTTDGYWNGNNGQLIDGTAPGNQDNVPGTYVSRADGTLDGIGTTVTQSTPTVTLQQQVCTGNATTTFPASNTPCGCTGTQTRVKQQTRTDTSNIVFTDGTAGTPTTSTIYTFQDITACTTPSIDTVTAPLTDTDQVVCIGSGTATFPARGNSVNSAPCGCAANFRRVKQRTFVRTRTTTLTDGVLTNTVDTTNGTSTFQDASACVPEISTTVTPISDKEHVKCVGNNTVSFSNGTSTTCGCTGIQTRIKERITDRTRTVVTTGGAPTSDTSLNNTSFNNFTGCTAPLVQTQTQTIAIAEQVVCQGSTNAAFGANGAAPTTVACGCTGNALDKRVKQRLISLTRTVTLTDGVITNDVTTAPAAGNTTFSDITTCNRQVVTNTSTVTHTQQQVCTANNTTTFPTSALFPGTQTGTTPTNVTCGCGAGQFRLRQRVVTGTRTRTTTDGVSTGDVTTITNPGAHTNGACVAASPAISLTPNPTIVTPVGTNSTVGATISAANFTISPNPRTTTGALSAPIGSGTNLTIALTPNPQTTTLGASNSITGSPAITLVPNPTIGVAGAPTSTINNGGTTVAVTISPNPSSPVVGAPTSSTSLGGAANTLSDVAMYYYKTDLRPTGTVSTNNVKGPGGTLMHQHMVTFTMGLGLDGQMLYDPNYETATSGDFVKIKTGATTCAWTTGVCNWPAPVANAETAIDDLWHAAVNGRGKYFSAKNPASLEAGLTSTLNAINLVTGAAASSSTSTPNLTPTDNFLFSSSYRTQKWDGEITAQQIDAVTGDPVPTPIWTAAAQLNAKTSASTDTRTIYTFSASDTTKLKPFLWANLTASEQAYFSNKCAAYTQCGPFIPTRQADANLGSNLLNWIRGQRGNELSIDLSTGLYRARDFILGDTVNSKPVFVGPPSQGFADAVTPDYPTFKTAQASRAKRLYVAANDGMLHALNADTGAEVWAYVPKMVMPNLWKLANKSYDIGHTYYVDGSPSVMDVFIGGAWKTILVGGLNSGGRGYYALDITDPDTPKGLWEICSDPALCAITDSDMGLSFGSPVITKRADGTPIVMVTSGYNNVTPGDGGGYLYILNAATGAVLSKIGTTISGTNVGNTTTPSGFAKVAAVAANASLDNTTTVVYGGDLLGNVWRFDLSTATVTVQRLATLKDGSTPARPQSITTRPEVTRFAAGFNVVYVGTGRLLGGTDLGDPSLLTPPEPFAFQQSLYGIKDSGVDLGDLRLAAANMQQQTLTEVSPAVRTITNNAVNWATQNGWYMDLNPGNTSPGERINLNPTLVRGVLVVTANEPNTQACSDGGNGFEYKIDYRTGSYVPGTSGGVIGGQISTSLIVGSVYYRTTTGVLKGLNRLTTGGDQQTTIPPGGGGGSGTRVSWRELVE